MNGTSNVATNLVFNATLEEANFAFRTIMYTPLPLQNGEDHVRVEVNDLAQSGFYGRAETVSNDIAVWIVEVNSPPTVTVPPAFSAAFRVPSTIFGVKVADPDVTNLRLQTPLGVADSRVSVNITVVGGGRVTLTTLSGLRFIAGSGRQDATVVLEGALVDVNNAIAALGFLCAPDFGCSPTSGPHSVVVAVSDAGRVGAGGVMSATATFPVTVGADPYP
jgi:hypothetical protein